MMVVASQISLPTYFSGLCILPIFSCAVQTCEVKFFSSEQVLVCLSFSYMAPFISRTPKSRQ